MRQIQQNIFTTEFCCSENLMVDKIRYDLTYMQRVPQKLKVGSTSNLIMAKLSLIFCINC